MSRRFSKRWVVLLLPFLAVRAFLPMDFMWSASADGLQLVMCPTQTGTFNQAIGATMDPSRSVDHAHLHSPADLAHSDHASDAGELVDSPCPYALAAVAITAGAPHPGLNPPSPGGEAVVFRNAFSPSAGPLRAECIRGPPHLS